MTIVSKRSINLENFQLCESSQGCENDDHSMASADGNASVRNGSGNVSLGGNTIESISWRPPDDESLSSPLAGAQMQLKIVMPLAN